MNITLIGAGNMGCALAKLLTRAGHRVRITARSPEKAEAVAVAVAVAVAANEGTTATAPADALGESDVVIVATFYGDAVPALRSLGDVADKVVIDISNPVTADYMALDIGHDTSTAEEIARRSRKPRW